MTNRLFVYGTLHPSRAPAEIAPTVALLKPIGPATLRGRLLDLGPYPGLILPGTDEIPGELFALPRHRALRARVWAALDAYVRRAMVNTHISWWRRRRLEEYPTDELPDQVVADPARESDMAEVVRRALDRLPQRMRAAVMLRYFEDMTEPEIAATLGISLGTVKSTVSRAVARLRIDTELGEDSAG